MQMKKTNPAKTIGPTVELCDPKTVDLPTKHFAILFEGAWLFKPDGDYRILATCPITNDCSNHECTFGIWGGSKIEPLPGFPPTMHSGRFFRVKLDGFEEPISSFDELFSSAAADYPFVYLPQKRLRSGGKSTVTSFSMSDRLNHRRTRRVSIPLPNLVVADGALVSAEIDGAGIEHCFGAPTSARRPVVTHIFVYEYCGDAATATVIDGGKRAAITADEDHPRPHLIFNIHPTGMTMDEAGQKCHTIATFETLRQSVTLTTSKSNSQFCDVAVYHERGGLKFCYGNSGLEPDELGLVHSKEFSPMDNRGPDLASCASGNVGVGS
jgi:hypothetical protein